MSRSAFPLTWLPGQDSVRRIDVYKRQEQGAAQGEGQGQSQGSGCGAVNKPDVKKLILLNLPYAVSYTHLDCSIAITKLNVLSVSLIIKNKAVFLSPNVSSSNSS